MNKNKKLVVIVSMLGVFIVILVALLVYTINVYKGNTNDGTAIDTSISTNSNANQSANSTLDASQQSTVENIDLKLYVYDADDYDKPKEVKTVSINKKLYQENFTEAINELLKSTSLKINKVVINEKMITVDLPKDVALKFNNGSAGGITYTNILAMTILNLPDIESMEVTVDGKKGVEADHFNFNGKFVKDENGQKYKFEESNTPSNEMGF